MGSKKTFKEMFASGSSSFGLGYDFNWIIKGYATNYPMTDDPQLGKNKDKQSVLEPLSDEWCQVVEDNVRYMYHRIDYIVPPRPNNWSFWQPWLKRFRGETGLGCFNKFVWVKYAWIDQDLKEEMTGRR